MINNQINNQYPIIQNVNNQFIQPQSLKFYVLSTGHGVVSNDLLYKTGVDGWNTI